MVICGSWSYSALSPVDFGAMSWSHGEMGSPLMIVVNGAAGGNSSSELFGDVLLDGIT